MNRAFIPFFRDKIAAVTADGHYSSLRVNKCNFPERLAVTLPSPRVVSPHTNQARAELLTAPHNIFTRAVKIYAKDTGLRQNVAKWSNQECQNVSDK